MTRYIANEANLKMMMNLLRDKSKNIQFEAFHVFKVSVLFYSLTFLGLTAVSIGVRRKSQEAATNREYPET
jgi:hypothetical protein